MIRNYYPYLLILWVYLLMPMLIFGQDPGQTLMISSKPAGATLFLNNQRVGVTPYQVNLQVGTYKIRMQHPDYLTFENELEVEKGDAAQLYEVTLRIKPAVLVVKTEKDVQVNIDEELSFTGSFETEISPGRHSLLFGGDLYEEVEQDVRLSPGEKKTVSFTPEKRFGTLEVITRPKGAMLRLNGKEIGESPAFIEEARVGRNRVEAVLEGYHYERRQVVVEDIRTTVVKIKMKRLPVTSTRIPEKSEDEREEEPAIQPLNDKEQKRWDKRNEVRDPFSWEYHDVAVSYIRGIVGNGVEMAYLNKVGGYFVYTTSPQGVYQTYGGGLLAREYVFGKRNRGGVFAFAGGGVQKDVPGYYWEFGQMLNLGRVTFSFGLSRLNVEDRRYGLEDKEYMPYNDLKVRMGVGVCF